MPKTHTVFDMHKYFKIDDSCWLWTGTRKIADKAGTLTYGKMYIDNRVYLAHRLMYAFFYGKNPGKLQVCHTCDVPNCVRPSHLFLGTHADNMHDMARKGRMTKRRFTNEEIIAIRADTRINREIGADYGVRDSHISMIKIRRIYRGVK